MQNGWSFFRESKLGVKEKDKMPFVYIPYIKQLPHYRCIQECELLTYRINRFNEENQYLNTTFYEWWKEDRENDKRIREERREYMRELEEERRKEEEKRKKYEQRLSKAYIPLLIAGIKS